MYLFFFLERYLKLILRTNSTCLVLFFREFTYIFPSLYHTKPLFTMSVGHSSKLNGSRVFSSHGEKNRTSLSTIRSNESFESSVKHNFGLIYTAVCGKYKTRPVPWVKCSVKANSIEILGDRMKAEDWQAAIESLSTDTGTHHVRIKNKRYTEQLAKNYDTFAKVVEAPK